MRESLHFSNFGSPACPGIFCRFIHPICAADGVCTNNYCTYEHYKVRFTVVFNMIIMTSDNAESSKNSLCEDERGGIVVAEKMF